MNTFDMAELGSQEGYETNPNQEPQAEEEKEEAAEDES